MIFFDLITPELGAKPLKISDSVTWCLEELTAKADIQSSIIKAPGHFPGYYQGWWRKTEQKWLTSEMISPL